jgi:hypothetical protein
MTREGAIILAKTAWWKALAAREVAQVQLYEELLCMPFLDFHKAVEGALGRRVFAHEFGSIGIEYLRKELEEQP